MFSEATADEITLSIFSDCWKDQYGCRPRFAITVADAKAWMERNQAEIEARIAAGLPAFADDYHEAEIMEPDAATVEAEADPVPFYIPKDMRDGWE